MEWEYRFLINRRDEQAARFTADEITVTAAGTFYLPSGLKSRKGENWAQVEITPKHPYRPRLGAWKDPGENLNDNDGELYTELLEVYLSDQGRAFELTTWGYISEADMHGEKNSRGTWLKHPLKPEEIQNWFTKDACWQDFTEPLQPLKGSTLERLSFLLEKVQKGEIIECFPYKEDN